MNNDPKSISLVTMVDYQKEAVVSKTIVDKTAGAITLFAFDQGQGLSIEGLKPISFGIDRTTILYREDNCLNI